MGGAATSVVVGRGQSTGALGRVWRGNAVEADTWERALLPSERMSATGRGRSNRAETDDTHEAQGEGLPG